MCGSFIEKGKSKAVATETTTVVTARENSEPILRHRLRASTSKPARVDSRPHVKYSLRNRLPQDTGAHSAARRRNPQFIAKLECSQLDYPTCKSVPPRPEQI
ncbi:hypothetical protein EVAR_87396_1 [Eumeta japonica]|uniref:Uncharacterized protein n=1 Tax=Eumeta variegata TaxID=151549 RepID=A0A4C1XZQ1_EUMVA|nr:hypothetical protein EVAR_87396_1 [Eumeta japonica]